jgi:drug/metabolite transporter (DMT)-like permease
MTTLEVTGGIILGSLLLGEVPSFNSVLGAAITLTGVAMVLINLFDRYPYFGNHALVLPA